MSREPQNSTSQNSDLLPRSLFAPQSDPQANLREMVDSIFSDRFMIFLSLLIVPIILVPLFVDLSSDALNFLDICDWMIVILFIAEYASKLYLAPNRWKHFKSPWHIVDLFIITLPFLDLLPMVGLSVVGSPSLLLRLLRLPRVLAVSGRAAVGRRTGGSIAQKTEEKGPATVIRQVDSELTVTHNLSWEELKAHVADTKREEWLDLQYVSDEGFAQLSEILGVAEPHFKSALMDDIYPHIDYVRKSSFIFVQSGVIQYPETASNFLTIERSGVIIICNGTKIITVSRHSIDWLEKIKNSVLRTRKSQAFVVPVLYSILEHLLDAYKAVLSEMELEVIKISGTPRSKLPKDFLERIYMLNKEVSRLVSILVHFKDMLSIVISKKVPLEGFDHAAEEAFHVLQDGAGYVNEISHDLSDNLRSIIDLYINQTSFETNSIIKILAVITAISVIPSAVGGLLGTNLMDTPYGATLWQLSFIITVSMGFAAYTFIKMGWLKT